MLMFFIVFVMLLSLICMMVNNIIVWWSVFLLMTLIFLMLNKSLMSYSSLFNYFILQELLGLLFLLISVNVIQLLIVMLKIGVSPLHFWIFSVLNNVYGLNLIWFLTFQKLPFLVILLQMMMTSMILFLFLGLMICLLQMLLMKSMKNLLILSSTESFNWIIFGYFMSFFNVLFIFFYYFLIMVMIIPYLEKSNNKNFLSWETMLIFMNLPFSINFFVKIFTLVELTKFYDYNLLLLLLMMFMSMLSLSFWMVNLSVININDYKYNKFFLFMYLPLTMGILI